MKAAPVLEVSNPFEVLGTLGARFESTIASPGILENFQPANPSPGIEYLDGESSAVLRNVCLFSGTSGGTGVK